MTEFDFRAQLEVPRNPYDPDLKALRLAVSDIFKQLEKLSAAIESKEKKSKKQDDKA